MRSVVVCFLITVLPGCVGTGGPEVERWVGIILTITVAVALLGWLLARVLGYDPWSFKGVEHRKGGKPGFRREGGIRLVPAEPLYRVEVVRVPRPGEEPLDAHFTPTLVCLAPRSAVVRLWAHEGVKEVRDA